MMDINLTDKQRAALKTLLQIAAGSEDPDDTYACKIVDQMLTKSGLDVDSRYQHKFFAMTYSDLLDLQIIAEETGEPIDLDYLEDEYGSAFSTIQAAIDDQEEMLLVDSDDTDFIAVIVDENLLLLVELWMGDSGQVYIKYHLENGKVRKGLHYNDII